MSRVIETWNFNEAKIEMGDEVCNISKNNVEYGKIPLTYNGGQFLIKVPKCKTMGVQSVETENGFTRRTMPLVFEVPPTNQQAEFVNVFDILARNVYDQLFRREVQASMLSKLESCFWRSKILYASIVESMYDCSINTRYFIDNDEVDRNTLKVGVEYDANAAILIDSIYVGSRTVCIQIKLYEVSLTPLKRRARVL